VIHPKWRTPAFSLIGQGVWAAVLTVSGRYDQLYTYVIYGMVLSYTLTVIAMFWSALEAAGDSAAVSLYAGIRGCPRFMC
jgi:amino acid transporter